MDLFFWLLALVVLSLTFAPFLASTYLLVTSAKDLVAACRLLVARSRVSSFPVVAVAVSVAVEVRVGVGVRVSVAVLVGAGVKVEVGVQVAG